MGRFDDVRQMEAAGRSDAEIADVLIGNQNERHNNYQDYQKFLDSGGRIGLQHDPLLYGSYALNPYLVRVQTVPMLVVRQGEVAVIKAAVGQPSEDTSGDEFKFGSIVRPGHRGIWEEPLRTGKYAINPRIYQAEMVPTAILTLNWAEAASQAHNLDKQLKQIVAKSKEGFIFNIDLQVQIHVSDKLAPKVISMVGTMQNLVNEVLQAVVGNYFRDTLQGMAAVQFIENRAAVQTQAQNYIADQIRRYNVETRGVYIQDVVLPEEIVRVLTQREIANQEKATFLAQREAQLTRIDMEKQAGLADRQRDLAGSEVDIIIKENRARARKAEAEGEATYIEQTGRARGAEIEAVGLARAKGFDAQAEALGADATATVNVVSELVKSQSRFVPDILVTGTAATRRRRASWASCANSSDRGLRDRMQRREVKRRSKSASGGTRFRRLGAPPAAVQASLRASVGLILSARLAGPMQASRHAASITADVTPRYPAKSATSSAGRPEGPAPSATDNSRRAPPAVMPLPMSTMARDRMPASRWRGLAPSAARSPISRVRRETLTDTSEKMPSADRNKTSAVTADLRSDLSRSGSSSRCRTHSSSGCESWTSNLASTWPQ